MKTEKIFDISVGQAKKYSIGASEKLVKFNHITLSECDRLKAAFAHIFSLPSAKITDSFQIGNKYIWDEIGYQGINLIQLDDRFGAAIIARHIKNKSALSYLLFDRQLLKFLLKSIEQENSFGSFMPKGTDLFWHKYNDKFEPMVFSDDLQFLHGKSSGVIIPWTIECLYQNLLAEKLIPGVFLSVLVLSIFPRIKMNGGCRQIIYYPKIYKILSQVDKSFQVPNIGHIHGLGEDIVYPKLGNIELNKNKFKDWHHLLSIPFIEATNNFSSINKAFSFLNQA